MGPPSSFEVAVLTGLAVSCGMEDIWPGEAGSVKIGPPGTVFVGTESPGTVFVGASTLPILKVLGGSWMMR